MTDLWSTPIGPDPLAHIRIPPGWRPKPTKEPSAARLWPYRKRPLTDEILNKRAD